MDDRNILLRFSQFGATDRNAYESNITYVKRRSIKRKKKENTGKTRILPFTSLEKKQNHFYHPFILCVPLFLTRGIKDQESTTLSSDT